jgi:transcriptional regulator with XRE-family HTH domain
MITSEIDEMRFREEFSEKLISLLESRGLNQSELSDFSGVSTSSISAYVLCKRTPSFYNVYRIARTLRCPVSYFL